MRRVWQYLQTSLWFLPAVLTGAAALLAFATTWLDRQNPDAAEGTWFLYASGAEGARGVLSTVAGSIMTVTGVVFSITIVVLQLASSQFTPRVLRSFTQDRVTQLVLGVFIGTFTYALLILRTVRSEIEDYGRFVPVLSVTVSMVLALVSVGVLIYFIHHVARSIQAEVIVDRVASDAVRTVQRVLAECAARPGAGIAMVEASTTQGEPLCLPPRRSGYVQEVDAAAIVKIAAEHDLEVRMEKRIGDFVLPHEPLLAVWPSGVASDVQRQLLAAIEIGSERTVEQDIGRGLIELSDIGVRALSPGINDPTTAMACIDRLAEVMSELSVRALQPSIHCHADGRVAFVLQRTSFDELLHLAYASLRQHASAHAPVALRLVQSIGRVLDRAGDSQREPLLQQLRLVIDDARTNIRNAADLALVTDAARPFLNP